LGFWFCSLHPSIQFTLLADCWQIVVSEKQDRMQAQIQVVSTGQGQFDDYSIIDRLNYFYLIYTYKYQDGLEEG
jgi:hypothetical protein